MNTIETAAPARATKNELCALLRTFINSRPGLDYANYGNPTSYRAEVRAITRQRADALAILRAVELRDSITADDIRDASRHAFAGRLEIDETNGKPARITYTAGQYHPTEYRCAAAAVLAACLWSFWRANMPAADGSKDTGNGYKMETYRGKSAGEYLRSIARSEFGRGIQSRYFN
jgi:hypothetical protein